MKQMRPGTHFVAYLGAVFIFLLLTLPIFGNASPRGSMVHPPSTDFGGTKVSGYRSASSEPLLPRPSAPRSNPYFEVNYTKVGSYGGYGGYGDAYNALNGSFYVVDGAGSGGVINLINESRWAYESAYFVRAGYYPQIALDPIHQVGFVNGGTAGRLTEFNTTTFNFVQNESTPYGEGVAVDPLHQVVMFAWENNLTFLNYRTWTIINNITVSPIKVAFDPFGDLVGYTFGNSTGVWNESSRTWVGNFSIQQPASIAYDPVSNDFLVGSAYDLTLIHVGGTPTETNYTLPNPSANANAITLAYGGADEALLWDTNDALGGATLVPFDIANTTFMSPIQEMVGGNILPEGIAIDPSNLDIMAVDSQGETVDPYLPQLGGRQNVTFNEVGLPGGTPWCVTLNGTETCSETSSLRFFEYASTYPFVVRAVPGFTASPGSGNLATQTSGGVQLITFTNDSAIRYPVTFTESGLPASTSWTVTLGNASNTTSSSYLGFTDVNGSYTFAVGAVPGYTTTPDNGTINIAGSAVVQVITFQSNSTPAPRATLRFHNSPPSCDLTFNNSLQANGSSVSFLFGTYNAVADPCTDFTFKQWNATGGVAPAQSTTSSTNVGVTGNGTLSAWFVWAEKAPPSGTVRFVVVPDSCGPLDFGGFSEGSGGAGTFTDGNYSASAPDCSGYGSLPTWTVTGSLVLTLPDADPTTVDVLGNGTLTATYTQAPPPVVRDTVSFVISPSDCGPLSFNGTAQADGTTASVAAGKYTATAPACTGYTFSTWSVTSAFTISGALTPTIAVTVMGNGTLSATYQSATPTLNSVTLSPVVADLGDGYSQSFVASATCSATCPAGVTYSWSMTVNAGTLNTTTGPDVTFTAGSGVSGTSLTVTAALNGVQESASAAITVGACAVECGGTPPPSTSSPGFLGLSGNLGWILIGLVLAVLVVVVIVAVALSGRKKKGPPAPPPATYGASPPYQGYQDYGSYPPPQPPQWGSPPP